MPFSQNIRKELRNQRDLINNDIRLKKLEFFFTILRFILHLRSYILQDY